MKHEAVIHISPVPWGGLGGGRTQFARGGGAVRRRRYHRAMRAYLDNIALECGERRAADPKALSATARGAEAQT